MELNNAKIHLIGIGGIGVSALARFFMSRGAQVSGSDIERTEITEDATKAGVKVFYQQIAENITDDLDLVIYSSAVPEDNLERATAKAKGIEQKSYFEYLGEMSHEFNLISVAGTHGKSTTTAMLADMMIEADLNPTVIVGSQYSKLDHNFRAGGKDLVLESCEYRAHFLRLEPRAIVLTNIEADHLDFYRDLDDIINTFQKFIDKLDSAEDILVYNYDDPNSRRLNLPNCRVISYGFNQGADLQAFAIKKRPGEQKFSVKFKEQELGEFSLRVPGDYNIYNALAGMAYALHRGVALKTIKSALAEFAGIWRRFEIIKNDDITVISDYGHHPTAVKAVLRGVREFYPGRRVVLVYQPHQRDRTVKLMQDFSRAFDECDLLILPEIYEVAGRNDGEIGSRDLLREIKKHNPEIRAEFAGSLDQTEHYLPKVLQKGDVVIFMGAGDIYEIASKVKFGM